MRKMILQSVTQAARKKKSQQQLNLWPSGYTSRCPNTKLQETCGSYGHQTVGLGDKHPAYC